MLNLYEKTIHYLVDEVQQAYQRTYSSMEPWINSRPWGSFPLSPTAFGEFGSHAIPSWRRGLLPSDRLFPRG